MKTKAPKKRTPLSERQIAMIKDLHWQGLSERKIAAKVGCSRSAVWGRLNRDK